MVHSAAFGGRGRTRREGVRTARDRGDSVATPLAVTFRTPTTHIPLTPVHGVLHTSGIHCASQPGRGCLDLIYNPDHQPLFSMPSSKEMQRCCIAEAVAPAHLPGGPRSLPDSGRRSPRPTAGPLARWPRAPPPRNPEKARQAQLCFTERIKIGESARSVRRVSNPYPEERNSRAD